MGSSELRAEYISEILYPAVIVKVFFFVLLLIKTFNFNLGCVNYYRKIRLTGM